MLSKTLAFPGSLRSTTRGALFFGGFFGAIGFYVPFLNLYFAQLGFSGQQIGLTTIIFPIATLFIAMPVSALADRRSWRVRILRLAVAGFAISFFFVQYVQSFAAIIFLLSLIAIFFTPIMPIANGLIARMASQNNLNFGSMRLWGSLMFAAAAAIGGWLYRQVGVTWMFPLFTFAMLPVALWAGLLPVVRSQRPANQERPQLMTVIREGKLLVLLVPWFLGSMAMSTAISFEGVYLDSLGASQFIIGLALAVSAFSELPTMHYNKAILGRWGGARTLILTCVLLTTAQIGYGMIRAPEWALLVAVCRGAAYGLFLTSVVSLINVRVPPEWTATAQALVVIFSSVASIIANPVGGYLFDAIDPTAVYFFCAALAGPAVLFVSLAYKRGWLE
jgi:MFS family permease